MIFIIISFEAWLQWINCVEDSQIRNTKEQIADILTNALPREKHENFTKHMGVGNFELMKVLKYDSKFEPVFF